MVKLLSWLFWQISTGKMQTLLLPSARKSCICHRMAPLGMLHIVTLIYIFKVTNSEMWISWQWWELAKNAQVWLSYRLIFAIERDHRACCTPWPWPSFSRSNIFLLFTGYEKFAGSRFPGRFASTRMALAVEMLLFKIAIMFSNSLVDVQINKMCTVRENRL